MMQPPKPRDVEQFIWHLPPCDQKSWSAFKTSDGPAGWTFAKFAALREILPSAPVPVPSGTPDTPSTNRRQPRREGVAAQPGAAHRRDQDEVKAILTDLADQVAQLRTEMVGLREQLATPRAPRRFYSVEEAAEILGKKPYTVREWCRHGRLHAVKRPEKRGGSELWSIASDEIARYQDEGLLPIETYKNAG